MPTRQNSALRYRPVAGFLKAMREKNGLTQRELAERASETQWWVYRCESRLRRVDVAEFLVYCEACGVDAGAALKELRQEIGSAIKIKKASK